MAAEADDSRHVTARGALALLIYLIATLLFFSRGLANAFTTAYIGRETTDPSAFMWFIEWWPYAIRHHLNPLVTRLLWAPDGTSLAWGTPIPLPALIAFPVEHFWGPVAAYNVLCLAAPVLAAWSAYLLCRWITKSFWPSILGGLVFGFSPYMLGHLLGHVDLVMVFPIPFAVLVALKRYASETTNLAYVVSLALLLVAQFLCFPELFATMTIMGGLAFAIALAVFPERPRLLAMVLPTVAAYAFAAVILSPYLFAMFTDARPSGEFYRLDVYSADLLNWIIPMDTNLLGLLPWARAIARHFLAPNPYENGAYVGIPLIVVAYAWRRERLGTPAGKLLVLMTLAAVAAACGPSLNVAGRPILPMPYALAAKLPLIGIALPARFSLYAFLAIAIIAASWFATSTTSVFLKAIAAIAIVVFLLPNPRASFWLSAVDTPVFFRDGTWRTQLGADDIVMPLPYEREGNSMLWQASAGMGFRLASGYTTLTPFEFMRAPIVGFFLGSIDLPEAGDYLKAFIASRSVTAIVEDERDPNLREWAPVLATLGVTPVAEGGVLLFRIPPRRFDAYRAISDEQVEARAVALRLDALLESSAAYLARGNPIGTISGPALYNAHLLPDDWKVSTDRNAFIDFLVVPLERRVAFAMAGSYTAMRPLAERYAQMAEVFCPYPERWTPRSNYPQRSVKPQMLFVFDPARLKEAAAELQSSPPPERRAPFLARVQ